MNKPEVHFLVCNSFRLTGEPQGVCNKKDATSLMQALEEGILERGLDGMVSSTSCLKVCEKGPIVVVYPQGWWYKEMDEDKIEEILDALEEGNAVEEYLM